MFKADREAYTRTLFAYYLTSLHWFLSVLVKMRHFFRVFHNGWCKLVATKVNKIIKLILIENAKYEAASDSTR